MGVRESPTSAGTVRVPNLNACLDVVAEVAAEFIVVRPFVSPERPSGSVQMYWKQTTMVRVHACAVGLESTPCGCSSDILSFPCSDRLPTTGRPRSEKTRTARGACW